VQSNAHFEQWEFASAMPTRTGTNVLDVALGAAFGATAYFPPMSNLAMVANCMFEVPS
jgi:hypothetical protein